MGTPQAVRTAAFGEQDGALYSKTLTVEFPSASENISYLFTKVDIYTERVISVYKGAAGSVTWNIRFAATRDATGTDLFASDQVTSDASGPTVHPVTTVIPAAQFVWLVTSAVSGTVTEFSVTLEGS